MGRRDERRRMAGGRFRRHLGGRRFVLGKDVRSRCDREVLQQLLLLMGVGSREEEIK